MSALAPLQMSFGVAVFLSLTFGIIGLVLALVVGRKPHLFWPALAVSAIGASGPMVVGYALVDEYLVGCVILGGLSAILKGKVNRRTSGNDRFHRWIFLLLMSFLVLESVRGFIFLSDLRMSRWVIYYLLFCLLAVMTWRWDFPFPSARQLSVVIAGTSAVYFGAYIAHGLLTECVRGTWRWNVQGAEWAGSAYAMFPLVLAIPAALFLIREGDGRNIRLAWAAMILATMAAVYYESRITFLAILVFLVLTPVVLGLRKAAFLITCLASVFVLVFWLNLTRLATPQCRPLLLSIPGTVKILVGLEKEPDLDDVAEHLGKAVGIAQLEVVKIAEMLFSPGHATDKFEVDRLAGQMRILAEHLMRIVDSRLKRVKDLEAYRVDSLRKRLKKGEYEKEEEFLRQIHILFKNVRELWARARVAATLPVGWEQLRHIDIVATEGKVLADFSKQLAIEERGIQAFAKVKLFPEILSAFYGESKALYRAGGTFSEGMVATAVTPFSGGQRDLDRRLHMMAAGETIMAGPVMFLFGGGIYSHRVLMRPAWEKLYAESLPEAKLPDVLRTTGLAAFMVDTGMVGVLLFVLNLLVCMRTILHNSRLSWPDASLLGMVLAQMAVWLPISNLWDLVIYFWALMPNGALVLLARRDTGAPDSGPDT